MHVEALTRRMRKIAWCAASQTKATPWLSKSKPRGWPDEFPQASIWNLSGCHWYWSPGSWWSQHIYRENKKMFEPSKYGDINDSFHYMTEKWYINDYYFWLCYLIYWRIISKSIAGRLISQLPSTAEIDGCPDAPSDWDHPMKDTPKDLLVYHHPLKYGCLGGPSDPLVTLGVSSV